MPSPRLTRTAHLILNSFFLRKRGGKQESPENLFSRVADQVALAEYRFSQHKKTQVWLKKKKTTFPHLTLESQFRKEALKDPNTKATRDRFCDLLTSLRFIPNSPTLMNAGKKMQQMASSFAIPIDDSLDNIFHSLQQAALVHQSGGGTGFSFSRLRPKGSKLKTIGGYTTGPQAFMRIFDAATEEVKKGGIRRGANMGVLRVDHPDIEDFVVMKRGGNRELQNFNISVGVTDEFMRAVKDRKSIWLRNPVTNKRDKKIAASRLFKLMAESAWACGDPGVLFLDRINRHNPTPAEGIIETTDSCGDMPLLPYEAAVLGAVNLSRMTNHGHVDWELLADTTKDAIRFLDDCIEITTWPLEETEKVVKRNRKVGLGVMGLADMLILLGLPYDSEEGVAMAEQIIAFINKHADEASESLAKERGVFPAWRDSIYNQTSKQFAGDHRRFRNATRLTISPTGTTSLIAGCSSGIEPLFAISYTKHLSTGQAITTLHPLLRDTLRRSGMLNQENLERIQNYGSLTAMQDLPARIRRIFPTARDISATWHLRMQAAFQRHVGNAVSKTVNLPRDATIREISRIFSLAYDLGCKGVSAYREGSLAGEVLTQGENPDQRLLFDFY
ncbi:MAG: adenosylcobalamin-dependent ribonucleoside-diphosphate reductase [archaeon]